MGIVKGPTPEAAVHVMTILVAAMLESLHKNITRESGSKWSTVYGGVRYLLC